MSTLVLAVIVVLVHGGCTSLDRWVRSKGFTPVDPPRSGLRIGDVFAHQDNRGQPSTFAATVQEHFDAGGIETIDSKTRNRAFEEVVFGENSELTLDAATKMVGVSSFGAVASRVSNVVVRLRGVESFVLTAPVWNNAIVPRYSSVGTNVDAIRSRYIVSEVLRAREAIFSFDEKTRVSASLDPSELTRLGFRADGGKWSYTSSVDVTIGYKSASTSAFNRVALPPMGYTILTRTARCDLSGWSPDKDVAVWSHRLTVLAETEQRVPFIASASVSGPQPVVTSRGQELPLSQSALVGTQGRRVYEFTPPVRFAGERDRGELEYEVRMTGCFTARNQWNAGTPVLYGTRNSQSLEIVFPERYMPRASSLYFWAVLPGDKKEEALFVGDVNVKVITSEQHVLKGKDVAGSAAPVARVIWEVPTGSSGTQFWIGWDWAEAIAAARAQR